MKLIEKYFLVDLVIYPFDILFSIGEDYELFKEHLHIKLPVDMHSEIDNAFLPDIYDARSVTFSSGASIIRFNKINEGILAHEIFHCAWFIMNRVGLKVSLNSEEAYAYLIGYITDQFYQKYK